MEEHELEYRLHHLPPVAIYHPDAETRHAAMEALIQVAISLDKAETLVEALANPDLDPKLVGMLQNGLEALFPKKTKDLAKKVRSSILAKLSGDERLDAGFRKRVFAAVAPAAMSEIKYLIQKGAYVPLTKMSVNTNYPSEIKAAAGNSIEPAIAKSMRGKYGKSLGSICGDLLEMAKDQDVSESTVAAIEKILQGEALKGGGGMDYKVRIEIINNRRFSDGFREGTVANLSWGFERHQHLLWLSKDTSLPENVRMKAALAAIERAVDSDSMYSTDSDFLESILRDKQLSTWPEVINAAKSALEKYAEYRATELLKNKDGEFQRAPEFTKGPGGAGGNRNVLRR